MSTRERSPVAYGLAGAVALGALQLLWGYVANRAQVDEGTRGLLKGLVFWAGVAGFMAFAGFVAVRGHEPWWKSAAVALLVASVGSSLVVIAGNLASGQGLARNSGLLGEPMGTQVAAGIAGIVVAALAMTAAGLVCGALVRWLARRGPAWRSRRA